MLSEADLIAKRAALRWLIQQHPEWTHQELAEALSMSRSWLSKWRKLLRQADPGDAMELHSRSRALTDQLQLTYPPYALGLCLVTAGRGATMPLKDVFDQPETMWLLFRRRLDRLHPYCRIAGHTEAEVRDILLALDRIYRPSFPELNLRQWTGSIYTWLTHPLLDPQKSGRVLMDHLMKLVTTALEGSYAEAQKDVSPKHLEAAAEQLTLRRDVIHLLDTVGKIEEDTGRSERKTSAAKGPNPK